jgi:hypothetical protein
MFAVLSVSIFSTPVLVVRERGDAVGQPRGHVTFLPHFLQATHLHKQYEARVTVVTNKRSIVFNGCTRAQVTVQVAVREEFKFRGSTAAEQ